MLELELLKGPVLSVLLRQLRPRFGEEPNAQPHLYLSHDQCAFLCPQALVFRNMSHQQHALNKGTARLRASVKQPMETLSMTAPLLYTLISTSTAELYT